MEVTAVGSARSAAIVRIVTLVAAIAILPIVLGLVTYSTYQSNLFAQQAKPEIQLMYEESGYAEQGVILSNINVDYRPADLLFDNPPIVTVIMGYQAGQVIPPDIASRVDEHLTSATGKDVRVRVGFVESQQTA